MYQTREYVDNDHATRFFDGITYFLNMLHFSLTILRNTAQQAKYQQIKNRNKY